MRVSPRQAFGEYLIRLCRESTNILGKSLNCWQHFAWVN